MRAHRRGFALIIALLTASAVFAAAMAGAVAVRAAVVEAGALRDRAGMERMAHGAAVVAVMGLATPAQSSVTESVGGAPGAPEEPAAPDIPPFPLGVPLDLSRGRGDAGEKSATAVGAEATVRRIGPLTTLQRVGLPARPVEVRIGGERCVVALTDELGVVNLNTAEHGAIRAYFAAVGATEEEAGAIADQVIDWRDEDDFVHPRGAERAEHARRGVAVRNGPMRSVSELLFLPAVTRDLYERARRGCCVEGDGRVYLGSATEESLRTLPGVTESNIAALLALRDAGPPFDEARVREAVGLAGAEAARAIRVRPTGRVRAVVEFPDRGGAAVEVMVDVHESRGVRAEVVPL